MDKLNWEKTKEGTARLIGVNDMPGEIRLPKEIEGLPLTEVSPYCFAKNKYLERIVLPDSVKKIERMAFYHCTNLRELEFGAGLRELGGDAFMNCKNLRLLKVRCGAREASGLRLILHQISSDMTVCFVDSEGSAQAVLLFPEYYESYDEVTPAHLFGRNIEGEGFRARQFFKDGVFEFGRYDGIFQKARAEERESTLCEMAMNRLLYPVELSDESRIQYEDYVKDHVEWIVKKNIAERQINAVEFLCKNKLIKKEILENCARMAVEEEWAEGSAQILRLKALYFPETTKSQRYQFDDF